MAARGYVLVARIDPENPPPVPVDADLAINVSVLVGTDYAYVPCDYWAWWGIPGLRLRPVPGSGWPTGSARSCSRWANLGGRQPGPPPVVPRVWAGAGYSVLTPDERRRTSRSRWAPSTRPSPSRPTW